MFFNLGSLVGRELVALFLLAPLGFGGGVGHKVPIVYTILAVVAMVYWFLRPNIQEAPHARYRQAVLPSLPHSHGTSLGQGTLGTHLQGLPEINLLYETLGPLL